MMRVSIKTASDHCTHLAGHSGMGVTICGMEMDGDSSVGIDPAQNSDRRINCPQCLGIIYGCREIPKRWIGSATESGKAREVEG